MEDAKVAIIEPFMQISFHKRKIQTKKKRKC